MRKAAIIIIIGIILYPFLTTLSFVVDQRQYAIVFAGGEIKQIISEPGLYFKMPAPMQTLVKLDRRTLTAEANEPAKMLTSDKKNVFVDAFLRWRITDPKLYFASYSGGENQVRDRVLQVAKLALNDEVSKRTMSDMVSGDRGKLLESIQKKVADETRSSGIEIVDVRIRRVEHVDNAPVYEQMKVDLARALNERTATGVADAEKIRGDADKESAKILADAYRDAQKIRGEADANASRLYAQAFGQNPEFAKFYRTLEAYRASFNSRNDVLVVDPSSEFFRYMKNPKAAK